MNRHLDVTEWLEALRIGADTEAADFAGELLALLDRADDLDTYDALKDDMEKAAGQTFPEPWRLVHFFIDRHHLLAEAEEALAPYKRADAFGNAGMEDTTDAVKRLLTEVGDLRAQVDALEYEIQHCGRDLL